MKPFIFLVAAGGLCFSSFNGSKSDQTVPVHFAVDTLINFERTTSKWLKDSIDVPKLLRKKDRALFLLDSVVNSPGFRDRVLKKTFKDCELSSSDVYTKFMSNDSASDYLRTHLRLSIDISWLWNRWYQKGNRVSIGYDNEPGDPTVNTVQVHIVNTLSAGEYAAHIAHEYCHMIGFFHKNKSEDDVPYGIQHIIEDMLESVE